ncbi:MAG: ATP-binding cassette domain-containing protein [Opitutales bacterium]|nr:ATP-binding cassette domain-containing protein [Opitutales bacterium]
MLALRKVRLAWGEPPVLDDVSIEILPGERVGLVGRNGTGKTSLLRLFAGEFPPDAGEVYRSPGTRLAYLPQDVPADLSGTVGEWVTAGLDGLDLSEWDRTTRVERVLQTSGLDAELSLDGLSAGMKRRVGLARCLATDPDYLVLDEPTNHLDIPSIIALEETLQSYRKTLLFVTHDREFLQRIAGRILDLDRGRLTAYACDYDTYLVRKEELLAAEEKEQAQADKFRAQEEVWIRRGIQARRTRNEGRVRRLFALREAHRERRARVGNVQMAIADSDRSGDKVVALDEVSIAYGGRAILDNVSGLIYRGDRIGLIGPNGAGKSTLIRLLLGRIQPDKGTVTRGTNLRIAYFDQMRETLDPAATVFDAVADGNEEVEINGKRRHVISYLQDFLFSPDRIRGPVSVLSGGERNRLLLARLFTRPFNFLVLDEPTNDLDLETLELLENLLDDYSGTLLLVSHDRRFLNGVVTDLWVMEGDGAVHTLAGDYRDFELWQARRAGPAPSIREKAAPPRAPKPRKFLNRERWEWERLPNEIEALEEEEKALTARLADPNLYTSAPEEVTRIRDRLQEITQATTEKFNRWEQLETLKNQLEP